MEIITQYIQWDAIIQYASYLLIGLGAFFSFTGAMGMMRMSDFYTRLHPAGLADSIGAPLILVGFMLQEGFNLVSGKLFLLIVFLLITGPTASHALAKAALLSGLRPEGEIDSMVDEE